MSMAPVMDAPRNVDALIPQVKAPDLQDVSVHLPPKQNDPELLPWFAEKSLVQDLPSHKRRFEESLERGDWVQINCTAFAAGKVIPFTTRQNIFIDADLEVVYPGILEANYNAKVGDAINLATTLSDQVPDQPSAGERVNLVVEIVAAYKPLSEEEKSGPGWENALKDAQAWIQQSHRDEIKRQVLAAVRAANPFDVDENKVEAFIHYLWAQSEGPTLKRMGIAERDMPPLLKAWVQSDAMQNLALTQMGNTAILRAYGEARGLDLTKAAIADFLKSTFKAEGMTLYNAADAALQAGDAAKEGMHGLWYLEVLDALVEEVTRVSQNQRDPGGS
jgi:FKBP-type peptidyl-prolyl cis-trans isomerase (trigger factor)